MVKSLKGNYRSNTLFLKKQDEDEFSIQDYRGLHFLDLTISSPQSQSNFVSYAGTDGAQQRGPVLFGPRTATANFFLETDDEISFAAKAHEVWQKFYSRTLLRLRQSISPGICVYGIAKSFDFTHLSYFDKSFSIQLDLPSGYRYSVLRSTDFPLDVKDNVQDGLNIGMNLPMEELKYTHSKDNFKIFNPSDFDIQPYEQKHDLNIIFKGSGSPTLKNKDTGDVFSYNKALSANDTLVLNGVHPMLNGKPCEIDTNHGDVQLVRKSWNHFSLTGFTGTVTFDFPFLYF
ncbi:MAG: phage tail family protein [Lactobacillus sp.]|nr:phage tail family protein [Lactobacillus sp.]